MNEIKNMNDYFLRKYVLNQNCIEKAFESEEIRTLAEKIYEDTEHDIFKTTKNDKKLKEMIYSYLSRLPENGIYITKWELCDDGIHCKQSGHRSFKTVIDDLESRIKAVGLEPDEYLLSDTKDADIYVNTSKKWAFVFDVNYGECEGIYFDLYVFSEGKLYSLLTGKTLDTSVEAYFKMNHLSGFCNILLRNDGYEIKDLTKYLEKYSKF